MYVGRIGRAVGLKGEVEVAPESDADDRFAPGSVLLSDDRAFTVRTMRTHGDRTIVTFEEISDRTGAEKLRGTKLFIELDQARPLTDGEFWDHDLIGCEVVTVDGERVGEVSDVLHHGANEVLVVMEGTKQHLIPLVADVVKTVVPGSRITIDPIPGLLD